MLPRRALFVLCLAVLGAGLPVAIAGQVQGRPIACGAIDRLERGAVWTYRVALPKGSLIGAEGELSSGFPGGPPRSPDDYDTKSVRVSLTNVVKEGGDTTVRLRIDEENPSVWLAKLGPCDVELKDAGGACSVTVLRGGVPDTGRMRYEYGRVPIACYPPLRGVPEKQGEKVLAVQGQVVRGWQATPSPDSESVTVEVRDYLLMPGVASDEEMAGQRWTEFYDAEANDIVSQPKGERDLPPVMLEAYEIQQWRIGDPMPLKVRRYTANGVLIMSCDLISGPDGPVVEPPPVPAEEAAPTERK